MMARVNLERYNDGLVSVYRDKSSNKTNLYAKINNKKLSDMEFIVKLCFKEVYKIN